MADKEKGKNEKLDLEKIKDELKKHKTPDEKKKYLDNVLKKISDVKLAESVKKLIEEISKQIDEAVQALEDKLGTPSNETSKASKITFEELSESKDKPQENMMLSQNEPPRRAVPRPTFDESEVSDYVPRQRTQQAGRVEAPRVIYREGLDTNYRRISEQSVIEAIMNRMAQKRVTLEMLSVGGMQDNIEKMTHDYFGGVVSYEQITYAMQSIKSGYHLKNESEKDEGRKYKVIKPEVLEKGDDY